MRDTRRERERRRHRQREKQASCREPDVGLNPRTPGSHHEPKADILTAEPPRRPLHFGLMPLYPGYHLGAMSLKPFTYPFPETRFLHAGPNVYKFKIRYGNNIRGEEIEDKEVIVQELEVGKEANDFWESYSLSQGYVHIQILIISCELSHNLHLITWLLPAMFSLQRNFTVFPGKLKPVSFLSAPS
uniref:Glycoprotein hormone subunit alpha 2 n=2 Tax=Canis lupus familiaris TaxID=9615 RepID=A0A8I3SB24_CANLF